MKIIQKKINEINQKLKNINIDTEIYANRNSEIWGIKIKTDRLMYKPTIISGQRGLFARNLTKKIRKILDQDSDLKQIEDGYYFLKEK